MDIIKVNDYQYWVNRAKQVLFSCKTVAQLGVAVRYCVLIIDKNDKDNSYVPYAVRGLLNQRIMGLCEGMLELAERRAREAKANGHS